jgi:hypothetical protein
VGTESEEMKEASGSMSEGELSKSLANKRKEVIEN